MIVLDLCVTHRLYIYTHQAVFCKKVVSEVVNMRITGTMVMALLVAAVSVPAMADGGHHPEDAVAKAAPSSMPMTNGQMPMANGQMPMIAGDKDGMPMMKLMEERHAMMQAHMTKMETHMANMEKLLQQLVDLQKK